MSSLSVSLSASTAPTPPPPAVAPAAVRSNVSAVVGSIFVALAAALVVVGVFTAPVVVLPLAGVAFLVGLACFAPKSSVTYIRTPAFHGTGHLARGPGGPNVRVAATPARFPVHPVAFAAAAAASRASTPARGTPAGQPVPAAAPHARGTPARQPAAPSTTVIPTGGHSGVVIAQTH